MMKNKIFVVQLPVVLSFAILFLIIAMFLYPGGTIFDHHATYYQFFENFLSNLGREKTYLGIDNSISKILFKSSIYLISTSFVVYFLALPFFFNSPNKSFKLTLASSLFFMISAIAFIGIGYFSIDPSTIFYHLLCVKLSFYLFFISSLLQTLSIHYHPLMNKKMFYSYLAFTLTLFTYNLLIEFGPLPKTNYQSLVLHVTAQKVIAFVFFLNFYVQSIALIKLIKSP